MRSIVLFLAIGAFLFSGCADATKDVQAPSQSSVVTASPSVTADASANVPSAITPSAALSSSAPDADVTARARGSQGQSLWVSSVEGLEPSGTTVRVRGTNFDESIGIYVALCVIPAPGSMPTPCGGGADMAGSSGASAWVSSNAPNYGEGLAIPFEPGGEFDVKISFTSKIGTQDCRKVSCAVVARADHLRSQDRSADVIVPVKFKQ